MSLEGLSRVPSRKKDPRDSWRSVSRVSRVVPAVILLVLVTGLLLRPETREWAEVQLNVAFLAVLGVAGLLLGPIYVRATMIAALEAFSKRVTIAAAGTVAAAIGPLLIAQVAACVLPAVLGFVAYMLGAPAVVFLAFVAVSFAAYAFFVPRRAQWEGWIARARPKREQRVERM